MIVCSFHEHGHVLFSRDAPEDTTKIKSIAPCMSMVLPCRKNVVLRCDRQKFETPSLIKVNGSWNRDKGVVAMPGCVLYRSCPSTGDSAMSIVIPMDPSKPNRFLMFLPLLLAASIFVFWFAFVFYPDYSLAGRLVPTECTITSHSVFATTFENDGTRLRYLPHVGVDLMTEEGSWIKDEAMWRPLESESWMSKEVLTAFFSETRSEHPSYVTMILARTERAPASAAKSCVSMITRPCS